MHVLKNVSFTSTVFGPRAKTSPRIRGLSIHHACRIDETGQVIIVLHLRSAQNERTVSYSIPRWKMCPSLRHHNGGAGSRAQSLYKVLQSSRTFKIFQRSFRMCFDSSSQFRWHSLTLGTRLCNQMVKLPKNGRSHLVEARQSAMSMWNPRSLMIRDDPLYDPLYALVVAWLSQNVMLYQLYPSLWFFLTC